MNILIIEQPLNNRGDESAHRGLITSLVKSYPTSSIKVLFLGRKKSEIDYFRVDSPNVEYVNIEMGQIAKIRFLQCVKAIMMLDLPFLLYLLPTIRILLRYYSTSDVILCAPGGMNMGGFQDWCHLAFLKLAEYMNKKTIYFARSIGPFSTNTYFGRLFRKKSISLLKYFSFISLRDKKSQEFANQLGIKYTPTIDSAFLNDTLVEIPVEIDFDFSLRYIVVVPNSLAWHKDFNHLSFEEIKEIWIKMIDRILCEYPELNVVMLPQTIGYSTMLPDGYRYFCDIKDQCEKKNRIYVLEEKYGSDVQQAIISKSQFLIGARYHSIVFAINQSIPFISLSYEHKMTGLLETLNMTEREIRLHKVLDKPMSLSLIESTLIDNVISLSKNLTDKDTQKTLEAKSIVKKAFQDFTKSLSK